MAIVLSLFYLCYTDVRRKKGRKIREYGDCLHLRQISLSISEIGNFTVLCNYSLSRHDVHQEPPLIVFNESNSMLMREGEGERRRGGRRGSEGMGDGDMNNRATYTVQLWQSMN